MGISVDGVTMNLMAADEKKDLLKKCNEVTF